VVGLKKGVTVIALVFFLLALSMAFSADHKNNKVDKEVEDLLKVNDEVSVIVVLEDDYDTLNEYSASELNSKDNFQKKKMMVAKQQDKVLSKLNKMVDLKLKSKFTSVNGFSGEITKQGLEKLRKDPNVKKIYPNRPVKAFLNDSKFIVNASKTWSLIYNSTNLTGKKEVICVIDTGVDYTHSDLGNCASTSNINDGSCAKVIGGYDFINNDQDPIDDFGHGTHVAGIVASTNITYRGIAPDANIIAIKSLGSDGTGSTQNVIEGIDWCVTNATLFNITVISMSLGGETLFTGHCDDSDLLTAAAIDTAIAKNISVIVAAGNDASTTGITTPACIRNSTAVGWLEKDNTFHSDSNRNNLTDLVAPGSSIVSLNDGGGLETLSGTSMAAPMVAGAFALMHQYFKLTENKVVMPNETQRYLNDTGKLIVDTGGSDLQFSRINIFEAIKSLDNLAPTITFVNPTLANKSNSTNATFFINVTSNEVLVNATLEFNGTNETMAGSGLNWFKNKTLDSGAYLYKVWGNDSSGNMGLSELRLIQINNTAPNITSFFPSTLVFSINEPNNQTFNITYNDLDGDIVKTSWYRNSTLVSTSSEFNFTGNLTSAAFYNITVFVSDEGDNSILTWNFTINNTNQIPTVETARINSTDSLNRTNGTLSGFFTTSDPENDVITVNETKWYNNTEEVVGLINLTTISSQNTTKGQNWTFSVRVFDGFNFSEWVNSTNLTIKNAAPEINITTDTVTVNETQNVNITTNASDIDNDALTFTINDSRFTLNGIYFIWNTNLTDSGTHKVNITVNDTEDIDSKIVTVNVLDAFDSDNDGNPDFNDTDDDNDGQDDTIDYLLGNFTDVTTNIPTLNITINSSDDFSKLYNETAFINISNGSVTLVEFNFTFNTTNRLNLLNITINRSTNGNGRFSIKGLDVSGEKIKKTIYLEKVNTTVKGVCILDEEADYTSISSACNATNEVLVNCTGVPQNGITCTETGNRWKIENLTNTAGKESCRDIDGDGYGLACKSGTDCDDSDSSKTTDCSSGSSSSSGSGGGGSGGGGGGGGLAATSAGNEKIHFYPSISSGNEIKINVNRENIAFTKTVFTVNKDLEGVSITLRSLEENDTSNTIENAYQYVEVDIDGITDIDIGNVKIDFEVTNSWFTINNFDVETVVLNRYGNGWKKLSTKKIRESINKTSYEATSPGFSLFAITAEISKIIKIENKMTKKAINETKKDETNASSKTGAAISDIERTSLSIGISVIVVTVIAGILVYLLFFAVKGKNKEKP